jgi:hypothetical protein
MEVIVPVARNHRLAKLMFGIEAMNVRPNDLEIKPSIFETCAVMASTNQGPQGSCHPGKTFEQP